MKTKKILRPLLDVVMSALLLLLMAYSVIGEDLHEWLGIAFFVCFAAHHIWTKKKKEDRYNG